MFEQLLIHLKNTCPVNISIELVHSLDPYVEGTFRGDTNKLTLYEYARSFSNNKIEAILFHELAHATGISHLLNRYSIVCVEKQDRQAYFSRPESHIIEEIVAESVALNLMDFFKINTLQNKLASLQYIENQKNKLLSIDEKSISNQINEIMNFLLNNWLKDFKFNNETKAA